MRKMLLGLLSIMIALSTSLYAEVPTKESVTKLYVATFNRAPDSAGLNYWLNSSGLQLEGIASSFFDQPETQEKYPASSTNVDFVIAVYDNLFNRAPDQDGLDYWVSELNSGSVAKSVFILAVINGAQNTEIGNDATILDNKTIVGLAFADAGLDDVELAIDIMSGITDDYATVLAALERLNLIINYPGELFPEIDEVELVSKEGKTLIETGASPDSIVTLEVTEKDKVVVSDVNVIAENYEEGYILLTSTTVIDSSNIGTPLFVNNIFAGMITGVTDEGTQIRVLIKNADNLNDAYGNLNIDMKNTSILESVQRAIDTNKIKGAYDDINTKPMQFSVIEKPVTNARGITEDEIVLRMDFPEGYYMPIEPRELTCSWGDAECTFTFEESVSYNIALGTTYENSGITFTTEDSYIEMGLGTYMKIHFDENLIADDIFDFTYAQSGYFKSNMQVSVSGELESSWSTDLKPIAAFDVEIVHPKSYLVKTSVAIEPVVTIGVEGKLSGSITATSYLERSGEVRFQYESLADLKEFDSTLTYTPKSLDKDSVEIAVAAEAHAYVFPTSLLIPNIKVLRINYPITLVYLRSGVKLDNAISGAISTGFVVENGEEQESLAAEVSVVTSLYGLVQSRWMVRAGGLDFYHTDEYADLYKTGVLNILEWKAQLLEKPQVIVKEDTLDPEIRHITFDTGESADIKEKLYFYYTIADTNEAQYDISAEGIESHTPAWRLGDEPISIDSNKIVKVRSVLYNKDVSDSIWAWGTSISEQTTAEVITMMKPVISPSSSSFEESLSITITQAQEYDIYYRLNAGEPQLYSAPFDITQSTSVTAYAKTTLDGKIVQSEEVTAQYTMCASNEELVDGVCVEQVVPIMLPPTASPTESEFTDSVVVTLSNPNDDGAIVYRINEGTPQVYTEPITLTDSAVIEAYVIIDPYDTTSDHSEIAVFTYTNDPWPGWPYPEYCPVTHPEGGTSLMISLPDDRYVGCSYPDDGGIIWLESAITYTVWIDGQVIGWTLNGFEKEYYDAILEHYIYYENFNRDLYIGKATHYRASGCIYRIEEFIDGELVITTFTCF